MQHIKHIFAFMIVLVISAAGSAANVTLQSNDAGTKAEVENRLHTAAEQLSKTIYDKSQKPSDRFAQWYNWNNWSNWSNWRNW